MLLSKTKCKAQGWWWEPKYVSIPIGCKVVDGKHVIVKERAHRLATWVMYGGHGPGVREIAMHVGNGDTPCTSTKCVNPYHLEWGDAQQNMHEYLTRSKRAFE